MARPKKLTLDFFLHDAGARSDRKIRAIRRKYGNDGYAAYFCLLEMLCSEEGLKLSLASQLDVETTIEECGLRDEAHLYKIIETCAEIGLFDKQLWQAERVVFSHGLFKRFLSRLEERRKDADRKKHKREAEALEKRIAELNPDSEIRLRDQTQRSDSYTYSETSRQVRPENSDVRPENSDVQTGNTSVSVSVNDCDRFEKSMRARTPQSLAKWRSTPTSFKEEAIAGVFQAFPDLYKLENGKPNIPKIQMYLLNLERKGEFEKLEMMLSAGSGELEQIREEQVASDRAGWLEEMRSQGKGFYKRNGRTDQDRYEFYIQHMDEVFGDVTTA